VRHLECSDEHYPPVAIGRSVTAGGIESNDEWAGPIPPLQQKAWNVLRQCEEVTKMKNPGEKGAAGYIAAWALGVPVTLLLIIFLLRGCT